MSFIIPQLSTKQEVDEVIRKTEDVVLVLRFGRENDVTCMQLDHILSKLIPELRKMAAIYTVDVDSIPVYTRYFDITLIPSTIFFFNAQHIKVDWGIG
ncbi:thioredoxin-like 4b protein, partial [Mytilus galloprovincialis]